MTEEQYKDQKLQKEYDSVMELVRKKTKKVLQLNLSDYQKEKIEDWIYWKQLYLNHLRSRDDEDPRIDSLNNRIVRARNHLNGFLPEPHIINN